MNEMEGKSLRQVMEEAGFINVTGMYEGCGLEDPTYVIPIADPECRMRWDYNNGMIAIIDKQGNSWVLCGRVANMTGIDYHAIAKHFDMENGCGVPMSNDGGTWAISMWPWAYDIMHIVVDGMNAPLCSSQDEEEIKLTHKHGKFVDESDPRVCEDCLGHWEKITRAEKAPKAALFVEKRED